MLRASIAEAKGRVKRLFHGIRKANVPGAFVVTMRPASSEPFGLYFEHDQF
jgi:hypothetical protein